MAELIINIIVIIAWITFYMTGAIAVNQLLGGYACAAFIAFFTGLILSKLGQNL
jgi:hypothetical protein